MRRIGLYSVALLLSAFGWIVYVNDFHFITEPVVVTAGGNRLTGTLVLPQHQRAGQARRRGVRARRWAGQRQPR